MPVDPLHPGPQHGGPPMGDMMGAGLQFAAVIIAFWFLGTWADGKLGTDPWLMIAGVFVGLAGGFWSLYSRLVLRPRQQEQEKKNERTK
jgi:F0F1-type ATP synthase assembly protein I